jgi:hypothetical protein
MTKPIFAQTDPRGLTVYLYEDRWLHALDQHPEMEGHEETVQRIVASPDKIVGNPPLPQGMPIRTAQEKYVASGGALNKHVVVVARTVKPGEILSGVGIVQTESRLVWTAHPAYAVDGPTLWPPVTVQPPKRR